jgi:hypothetical protein
MAKGKQVLKFKDPAAQTQDLELVTADFGKDVNAEIEMWVKETLQSYKSSHQDLHENKIPRWRDRYLGKPLQEKKTFPWSGAANTVVQVIGTETDDLVARTIGFIFATSPLWVFKYFAKVDDPQEADLKRRLIEDFMDTAAYEPDILDIYRIEGQWFTDSVRLGTSFVKVIFEDKVEQMVVGYTGKGKEAEFDETTLYKGPRVTKLRHEDILMNPAAQTVKDSRMVAHRRILSKYDLELRAFQGFYDRDKIDLVLSKPDRSGPDTTERREEDPKGIHATMSQTQAEWDIWECYFPWFHKNKVLRLIYSYHLASNTCLRSVFNFVPNNETPIVRAKLGYRNDLAYGTGFAELLGMYQEEISTVHNQRLDNATAANVRSVRVSPRARNLDSNVELTPWAVWPGEKDDIEAIQMSDVYPSSFQNEEVTLGLASKRAGVSAGMSAAGAGGPGKAKTLYQSQGTIALMQEGNQRNNLVTADFRHSHQKLGSLLALFFGKFGTNGLEEMFGDDAPLLKEAFREFMSNRLRIPIRSSNASLNREVERQTDVLMVGLLQRHFTSIGQMIQAANNPMVPPEMKKWLTEVIRSINLFVRQMLKDFGKDQPEEYIPDVEFPQEQPNAQGQLQVSQSPQQPGAGEGTPQPPGLAAAGGGPQPNQVPGVGGAGGRPF